MMRLAKTSWRVVVLLAAATVSCSGTGATEDALNRAVVLETTGCEFASGRTGSGFIYERGTAVTAAHLVARASAVTVETAAGAIYEAEIVGIDLARDLAALQLKPLSLSKVEKSVASTGDLGLIVGGAKSGTVTYEVRRVIELTIEEVLGTERHRRSGYELAAVTGDGDSGSGVYDAGGRLVGMVFATGPDEGTTWVTAASEIEDFLASLSEYQDFVPCS